MTTPGPLRRGHYRSPSALVSPESSPLNTTSCSTSTPRYHPSNTQPSRKSCLAIPTVFRKYGNKPKQRRQPLYAPPKQFHVVSNEHVDDEGEPDWSGPSPAKSLERLLAPPPAARRKRGLYDGEMEPEGRRGQEAKPLSSYESFPLPKPSKNMDIQILRPVSDPVPATTSKLTTEHRPSFDVGEGDETNKATSLFQTDSFGTEPPSFNHEREKEQSSGSVEFVDRDGFKTDSSRIQPTSQRQSLIPVLSKTLRTNGGRAKPRPSPLERRDRSDMSNGGRAKPRPSPLERRDRSNVSIPISQQTSSRKSAIPTLRSSTPRSNTSESLRTPSAFRNRNESYRTVTSAAPTRADAHPIHKTPSSGGRTATTASSRSSSHLQTDAESLQNLAMRHVDAGEYDAAIQTFSKVLQSHLSAHGSAHPATASSYHNLGTVHAKRGTETCLQDSLQQQACRSKALECFQAAARSARDSLGPNHPNVAVSLIRVGFILLQSRQYENAITTFTEALRVRQASYGKCHGLTANVYNNLGVCYMHMDQFEKAWDSLEEALAIQRNLTTSQAAWLELSDTLFNRGGLCLEGMRRHGPDVTRAGQAISSLEEASRIREEHLGEDHPSVIQVQGLLEQAQSLPVMKSPGLSPITRDTSIFRKEPPTPPMTHISVVALEQEDDVKEKSDVAISSVLLESFENDASPEKRMGDESCLISESGVESGQGKVHYPLVWNKAGIHSGTGREYQLAGLGPKQSSSPGSVVSTGNKARDDILQRARSILKAHSYDTDIKKTRSEVSSVFVDRAMDISVENEVAPLGGSWGHASEDRGRPSMQEMLQSPSSYLEHIYNEAVRLLKLGEAVDAQQLFTVVLQCQRRRHGPLHPDVAAALHNTGITHLRTQNHIEALEAFEEASRIRKGSMGKEHPLVAVSLVKVGITLLLLKRFDEALWSFRQALTVRKNALGSLHPSTARIYNNIGCVYVEFSEFKQARRAFEAALDIQRSALSTETEDGQLMFATATTLSNLGYLYRFRDMHSKAAFVLKEALGMQEKVLGKSHPTVLSTMDNLADSCANSGNSNEALNYYFAVLERIRAQGGKDMKSRRAEAVLLYKLSRVYRKQSKWVDQLSRLTEALQIARSHSAGPSDPLERKILFDIRASRENLGANT